MCVCVGHPLSECSSIQCSKKSGTKDGLRHKKKEKEVLKSKLSD